jgi:hypothetical protein
MIGAGLRKIALPFLFFVLPLFSQTPRKDRKFLFRPVAVTDTIMS